MRIPTNNVPILPLSVVLFPEGSLSLRIFETRYLDMVSACLKQDVPFGVCMIAEGYETGKAARSYRIGTLSKIINWGQTVDGVLKIDVLGCQRFKILESEIDENELVTASIQVLGEPSFVQIPESLMDLTSMLKTTLNGQQSIVIKEGQFTDANWVGYRLTEILPIENVMRQRLLEIDNPLERLQTILRLFSNR